ncbi:hypothetical protein KY337_00825 [Candidatus Woesearchaeota archaeon]|nr:hypothetical protein [Candidatus Woesearchaeota archaeon]
MVSFLDIGLLQHFSFLFPVFFVFVAVFAVLERFKLLGENKGVHALIAAALAGIILFSKNALSIVTILSPWFVIAIIFLIFLFLLFMMFGVKESDFVETIKENKLAHWSIIIVAFFMLLAAVGKTFFAAAGGQTSGLGQAFVEGTTAGVGEAAFWLTLFHPKVLGVVFVLLIAMLAVRMLSGNMVPKA